MPNNQATDKVFSHLPVYESVRAVGLIKPKFDPVNKGFIPPQLEVIGTAFLLKEYQVIITCEHVIRNFINLPVEMSGVLVIGRHGKYAPVSIDSADYAHDLAVLRFTRQPNATDDSFRLFLNQEFASGLGIVDKYYPPATEIAYAGFPLGTQLLNQKHDPTYVAGVVGVETCVTEVRKEVRISGPVTGGFSGSPIVLKDDSSKLLAVISNSPGKDAGNANIFMGISWEHVKAIAALAKS